MASEKAAERAKLDRQAGALWGEFLADLDRGALWSSLALWRTVAEELDSYRIKGALAKAATPAEGLDNLLRALYERCERYSVDGRGKVIDLELLAKLVQRLEDRKR